MEISLYPAYNVISKMIYADPEMRRDIMCIGGTSQWPATIFRGIDQWGERYGYLLADPIGGAVGAFSTGDGISTGGQSRTPICKLPNIEHTEQTFPLLFLYRKEVTDSGGAGKFRGGLSAESCFVPHHTDRIVQDTLSSGNAVPTSMGMMGGYPAAPNVYRFCTNSDIRERFAQSRMVGDIDELEGERVTLQLRQQDFVQGLDDVYAVMWSAAGGFGDPMERDPEAVRADVENRAVSRATARQIYGVALDEKGAVDRLQTDRLRSAARAERLKKRTRPPRVLAGETLQAVTETLVLRAAADGAHFACAHCAADLGPAAGNYKEGCLREDNPIGMANPLVGEARRFVDADPVFRQFFCPGCGGLVENEVALADEPVLRDIELAPQGGVSVRRQAAE